MVECRSPKPNVGGSSPSWPENVSIFCWSVVLGKLKNYVKESVGELKKVSWPKKDEIVSSTWIVIIFIIVFAIVLGLIDFGAVSLVRAVIR